MNRWVLAILLIATGVGLAFRIPALSARPLHNDEGVNGYKFAHLWEKGEYKYDHNEHHGPTLYYATWLVAKLTGTPGEASEISEGKLRLTAVLFGLALFLVMPLVVDGLGRRGLLWAAAFTAVSPAMVFYSRYYIHEMMLVFFAFLAGASGWRYTRSRKPGWALLCGVALGLMHATKETFVLSLFAAGVALASNYGWNRWLDASEPPTKRKPVAYSHMLWLGAVWLFTAVLFFSSFFTNWSGPWDSIRTYIPWLNRAGGDSPHIHPWYFYFHRLLWFQLGKGPVWTELLILLLAVVGAWSGFARKRLGRASGSFVRFTAIYTVVLAAVYSSISYKTPWCLLNFWHGAILLAGIGAAVLLRVFRKRVVRAALGVLLAAGCAHLGWQSYLANFVLPADPKNPHVYAHTSADFLNLTSKVLAITSSLPTGDETLIKVVARDHDFWPLPWYLRRYSNVGWWGAVPQDAYAPLMIVSARFGAGLDENRTHLMVGYFQLRPQEFFELYVELEAWKLYLAKNPPPREE